MAEELVRQTPFVRCPVLPLPSPGELEEMQRRLGIRFRNPKFLQQALIHRSFVNEANRPGLENNERLEWLGDAVLEIAVTEYLFKAFPKEGEGRLTSIRAALVNKKQLAGLAEKLGLDAYIRMSRGESKGFQNGARSREPILACAFEAVLGALFLDRGQGTAELFLSEVLLSKSKEILEQGLDRDPKSHLQELMQARDGITPSYRVLEESGPDHDRTFSVGVYAEEREIGRGQGSSKSEGQVSAARVALYQEFQVTLEESAP